MSTKKTKSIKDVRAKALQRTMGDVQEGCTRVNFGGGWSIDTSHLSKKDLAIATKLMIDVNTPVETLKEFVNRCKK